MKNKCNPGKTKTVTIKGKKYKAYLNSNGHGGSYWRISGHSKGNHRPYLHQAVKGVSGGKAHGRTIDHKNKRHSDNRASNLAVVSNRENVRREHQRNGEKVRRK